MLLSETKYEFMIGTYFPAINMRTKLFTSPIAHGQMMDETYFYTFFEEKSEQWISETMEVISKYQHQHNTSQNTCAGFNNNDFSHIRVIRLEPRDNI